MNYIKVLRVPQLLGLLRHAVIDFYFSALEFIFNMQKNTVSVLAAHFPYIKDDTEILFIISYCTIPFTAQLENTTSFYHILSQKHFPAH